MCDSFKYQGNELALFQHAKNWKNYFSKEIIPYIKGDVLEVGAGIGSTTLLLNNGNANTWLMLEPDSEMSKVLEKKINQKELPANCQLQKGTIKQLSKKFDTIIYIDVLEHIEKDKKELGNASLLLNENGHIIVLSPAFNFLYSPFDKEIGHFRRYRKKIMKNTGPENMSLRVNRYLDSSGFLAALVNKIILRQKYPSIKQVLFWDRWMIPVSRITDKLFLHSFGKTIISIWQKSED